MSKVGISSASYVGKTALLNERKKTSTFITDLKLLLKAGVLLANVLPVFTGFWLALHFAQASLLPHWQEFLLTMIGSTMVMAGALILNNWYDVDIDAIMERTKNRPTVTGHFSLRVVFLMGMIFTILGLILLLFTTIEAAIYALVGWFTYVIMYTVWSKRRYSFNTLIGSVSGAVTPLIGWTAIEPELNTIPITLFLILFIWQMPHTYAIAMKKCKEYKAAGVAMLPVVHGMETTKRKMVIYIACLFPVCFYLAPIGTTFIIVATSLNIIWFIVGLSGFFIKNDLNWAHIHFLYSVNYIMILLLVMVLNTL